MSPSLEAGSGRRGAHEVKFRVSAGTAESIRVWAREFLEPDPYGGGPSGDVYRITSLYLDTPTFDVYFRRGSFGRAKFRIRRYDDGTRVFLERKLKAREMVRKLRSPVKAKELDHLEDESASRDWAGRWFHRRINLRALSPVCQISYTRTARLGRNEHGSIRLTLDQDLRAAPARGFAFDDSGGGLLLAGGDVILELKFRGEMPARFAELTAEFGLVRQALSKYRMAARALGVAPPSPDREAPRPALSLEEELL